MYDKEMVTTGKEDACYFSRGAYTIGRNYVDEVLDKVRLEME